MTTPTVEERLATLENEYGNLATKADVEKLRADLIVAMADLETRLTGAITQRIDRLFLAVIGVGGAVLAVALAALLGIALT